VYHPKAELRERIRALGVGVPTPESGRRSCLDAMASVSSPPACSLTSYDRLFRRLQTTPPLASSSAKPFVQRSFADTGASLEQRLSGRQIATLFHASPLVCHMRHNRKHRLLVGLQSTAMWLQGLIPIATGGILGRSLSEE
jgi:hypothetical protein